LTIRPLGAGELVVVHLDGHDSDNRQVTLPAENAFFLMLYLVDVEHQDLFRSGPPAPFKTYPQGSICLIDLDEGAAIAIRGSFEVLAVVIPRAFLQEVTHEAGDPPVSGLRTCRGVEDAVISSIGGALIGMFDMPSEARKALLANVGLAFSAHIVHRYGEPWVPDASSAGAKTLH
jgi:hypothetical protein